MAFVRQQNRAPHGSLLHLQHSLWTTKTKRGTKYISQARHHSGHLTEGQPEVMGRLKVKETTQSPSTQESTVPADLAGPAKLGICV